MEEKLAELNMGLNANKRLSTPSIKEKQAGSLSRSATTEGSEDDKRILCTKERALKTKKQNAAGQDAFLRYCCCTFFVF